MSIHIAMMGAVAQGWKKIKDTFVELTSWSWSWTIPAWVTEIDVLVVWGGWWSGRQIWGWDWWWGWWAGGLIYIEWYDISWYWASISYSIWWGWAGWANENPNGTNWWNTTFWNLTAIWWGWWAWWRINRWAWQDGWSGGWGSSRGIWAGWTANQTVDNDWYAATWFWFNWWGWGSLSWWWGWAGWAAWALWTPWLWKTIWGVDYARGWWSNNQWITAVANRWDWWTAPEISVSWSNPWSSWIIKILY